jgi:hypothetical protein
MFTDCMSLRQQNEFGVGCLSFLDPEVRISHCHLVPLESKIRELQIHCHPGSERTGAWNSWCGHNNWVPVGSTLGTSKRTVIQWAVSEQVLEWKGA